jgi:hypothetical protein
MKLSIPTLCVLHFIKDFTLEPQAAVGVVDLGALPENFVVDSVYVQELSALTAGTTIKVGPTADDDGYLAAVDPAAIQKGVGALLGADAADVDAVLAANQKLLLTTAVNPAVAGKIAILIKGFQAF